MTVLDGLLASGMLGSLLIVAGVYALTGDDANGWWARMAAHASGIFVGLIASVLALLYSPWWMFLGWALVVLAHGIGTKRCSNRCLTQAADEFPQSPERADM